MKRPKAVKEEHLNALSKMYFQGKTQMEMASVLSVSQGQISNDLRFLMKQWEESRLHDIDRYKNEQLARINAIEEEMWQCWEKSKTAKKVIVTKSKSGDMLDAIDPVTGKPVKVQKDSYWRAGTTEEEAVNGDMQYMNGIQWCVTERNKILGIYAPKKVAQTDPTGEREASTAKEILGDIIGGILKRSANSDTNLIEGEVIDDSDETAIEAEYDDTPELARRLREERLKKLPAPKSNVQFDQDGNILTDVKE